MPARSPASSVFSRSTARARAASSPRRRSWASRMRSLQTRRRRQSAISTARSPPRASCARDTSPSRRTSCSTRRRSPSGSTRRSRSSSVILDRVAGARELSPRTRDDILARGERLSAAILSAALERAGIPSTVADAQEFLHTDGRAGNAAPDLARTDDSARAALEPLLDKGLRRRRARLHRRGPRRGGRHARPRRHRSHRHRARARDRARTRSRCGRTSPAA